VEEVILEFGRRPSADHGINLIYTDQTYPLRRSLTRNLPTAASFDVTFTFNINAIDRNPLVVGELLDYQFRVTHLDPANGNLVHTWSERRTLQVGPRIARSPTSGSPPQGGGPDTPPQGGAPGSSGCGFQIANVSRPPTTISGGSTIDGGSNSPIISADGRFVFFVTRTQFDPDASTDLDQIYRRDLLTGAIVAVSRPANSISGGSITERELRAPSISGDGRFVAFVTRMKFDPDAADVDQVYVRDLDNGTILRVTTPATTISGGSTTDRGGSSPVISADGRFVTFVSRTKFDPNAADVDQIYRRDLQTGAIVAVSRPATSISGGSITDLGGRAPSISGDGRFVAFVTRMKFDPLAADVDQVYVRDLNNGTIRPVSTPARTISGGSTTDRGGSSPIISADGRFVFFITLTRFDSNAADLDQIYRRDLQTGAIVAVSRPANSILGGSITEMRLRAPSISGDGRFVAFVTQMKFDPDSADVDQVFVRDLDNGTILRVTTPATTISGGSTTDRGGNMPVISGDGFLIAFVSRTKFDSNAPDVDEIYLRCVDRP